MPHKFTKYDREVSEGSVLQRFIKMTSAEVVFQTAIRIHEHVVYTACDFPNSK